MRGGLLLAALALAACSSTPNRPVRPGAQAAAGGGATSPAELAPEPSDRDTSPEAAAPVEAAARVPRDVVAHVAGRPILAADVLEAWLVRASPEVRATLEELVLSRLVLAEAARLGIELDPDLVRAARKEVLQRLEERVAQSGGTDVPSFVSERLGLDPDRYLDRLARETSLDLLAERVVRAWLLASERAEVRVIVLDDRQRVETVQQELARGADFAELAARHSVEDSAGDGGRIPPVVRGRSALARLAFATTVGEVGGPVSEAGRWLLLRVDARPEPLEGTWETIGGAVEESLASLPIEDPEYWQWKADALERYEVDLTPFLELVGGMATE